MFEIQNYSGFLVAVLAFQSIPGPGTMSILQATAKKGFKGGMAAVFGTITGDFIYMAAAMMGVAALLRANPVFFDILQWAGIIYLFRIGFQLIKSPQTQYAAAAQTPAGVWKDFRRSLLVCLMNPKAVFFFLAFFPLFLKPDSSAQTAAAIVAHVSFISFLYQTFLVLSGSYILQKVRPLIRESRVVNRILGLAFIGFGLKLMLQKR